MALEQNKPINPFETKPTSKMLYLTSVLTALVAGIFSLIVCLVLFLNYLPQLPAQRGLTEKVTPLESAEMTALKQTLMQNPSERLREQIRGLDLQLRQEYFHRKAVSALGAWYLLAGLVVFFSSMKLAAYAGKKPPMPTLDASQALNKTATLAPARFSVAALALILVAASIALIVFSPPNLIIADTKSVEIPPHWPRFRGPGGLGVSTDTNMVESFNIESGENILWKSPVPSFSHSSPIVWGDRIFLTGGDAKIQKVFCYDAKTGGLLWARDVQITRGPDYETPDIMEDTGAAAATPATDGKRFYAIFATGDLAAFDFDGKQLWVESFGVPDSIYGYATSLAVYKNNVIVQLDQGPDEDDNYRSKLYAINGATGKLVWAAVREVYDSWTSPIVIDTEKLQQIITISNPWIVAYNPNDGVEIWRVEGFGSDVAPSPIYAGGLVIATHCNDSVYGIRPDGQGNVTESHVAWTIDENLPETCSPVANDQLLFLLDAAGYLGCFDVKTGERIYEHDLEDMYLASPTLVGDKLYLFSEKGVMHVAAAGREFKTIAKSELKERLTATPAFVDGRIYVRGEKNLYCLGKKSTGDGKL